MNIILIVIDTLRYDHIGFHGNDWIRTPNIDRFASESWVFDRCFAASYPTIPHRTDAITGRYGGPFHAWQPLRFDMPTLPQALAQMGYCSQLIHDTPHLVNGGHNFDWPFHAWTFVRGAEVDRPWITDSVRWLENWTLDPLFDQAWEAENRNRTALGAFATTYCRANRNRRKDEHWNCAKLFLKACEFLSDNTQRENFFLWLDCFDPHEPWDAPPEFMKLYDNSSGYDGRIDPRSFSIRNCENLSSAARNRIRAAYAAKVSWVDRWLGELLDALERTGLNKKTAVLLTSDHGTNLGEYGRFGKGFPVRENEAHVPLILHLPGAGSGRSDAIIQPQDIFATVLAIAGGRPPARIDSHDILKIARREITPPREIALSGITAKDWNKPEEPILFTVFDGQWSLELATRPEQCRLRRMGELQNVADEHPNVVQQLRTEAIEEIDRRGADPAIVHWLRSEGAAKFPDNAYFGDNWPGPTGFTQYFFRLYEGD